MAKIRYAKGIRTRKYKSRLEAKIAKHLPKGTKYESTSLDYIEWKKYIPDFTLPNGIILEVKGWFRPEDRRKMLAVKSNHPFVDIRLVFASDNKLNKNSNTRYSDWCNKWGFKFCIGRIPKQWLT